MGNMVKRVFQSNKSGTNYTDIKSNTEFSKFEENMVYSTPKEEREKKEFNKDGKKNFEKREYDGERRPYVQKDGEQKRPYQQKDGERRPYQNKDGEKKPYRKREEEQKPKKEYDSDGFEKIVEKVKTTKKRNFDGEKRRFKDDGERERPQTGVRKNSNMSGGTFNKPKPIVAEKVTIEVGTASNLKDLLK